MRNREKISGDNKIFNFLFEETDDGRHREKKETVVNVEESAASTANHLGVPKANETNPNLLSPEILGQRRGECAVRWKGFA